MWLPVVLLLFGSTSYSFPTVLEEATTLKPGNNSQENKYDQCECPYDVFEADADEGYVNYSSGACAGKHFYCTVLVKPRAGYAITFDTNNSNIPYFRAKLFHYTDSPAEKDCVFLNDIARVRHVYVPEGHGAYLLLQGRVTDKENFEAKFTRILADNTYQWIALVILVFIVIASLAVFLVYRNNPDRHVESVENPNYGLPNPAENVNNNVRVA